MAGTGVFALWLSTAPDFAQIKWIFIGRDQWTHAVGRADQRHLSPCTHDQQGRFFGLLESGRGLVEALLASIGLAVFAYFLNSMGAGTSASLTAVIVFYGWLRLAWRLSCFSPSEPRRWKPRLIPIDAACRDLPGI